MTICFAAILSAVVEERIDAKAGAMLLRPLLAIGIFSLLLWRWTDDLRLYAGAQFFPFLALVLILSLFPPKYTGTRYWVIAAALYALAKLLEFLDEKIYSLGSIVSGHTLKHLAAAAASLAILRLLQTRRPTAPAQSKPFESPAALEVVYARDSRADLTAANRQEDEGKYRFAGAHGGVNLKILQEVIMAASITDGALLLARARRAHPFRHHRYRCRS
jgi:hypothetical protein